jgi:hypothetical protein
MWEGGSVGFCRPILTHTACAFINMAAVLVTILRPVSLSAVTVVIVRSTTIILMRILCRRLPEVLFQFLLHCTLLGPTRSPGPCPVATVGHVAEVTLCSADEI